MLDYPILIPINENILYLQRLSEMSFTLNGNRKPLWSCRRTDPVPMSPAACVELDVVIEDEYICAANLIKVSAPRDVGGLQDDALH